MDTPSGRGSNRVADHVTRHNTYARVKRNLILIFLTAAIGAAGQLTAQEEVAPEPAVTARLAAHTLALDAFAVEDAFVAVGERGHILVSTDGGATWF